MAAYLLYVKKNKQNLEGVYIHLIKNKKMNRRKETNQREKEMHWRFAIAIFQGMFGYLKIKCRTITADAMHAKRRPVKE